MEDGGRGEPLAPLERALNHIFGQTDKVSYGVDIQWSYKREREEKNEKIDFTKKISSRDNKNFANKNYNQSTDKSLMKYLLTAYLILLCIFSTRSCICMVCLASSELYKIRL